MSKTALTLAAAVPALSPLVTGCAKNREAPLDVGVCYAVVEQPDKKLKFNKVSDGVKSLEFCAAALEKVRLQFLRLGGSNRETTGAYQGHFLFLQQDGIYSSETYDGPRFITLVRYNDKLVMPGAVPQ